MLGMPEEVAETVVWMYVMYVFSSLVTACFIPNKDSNWIFLGVSNLVFAREC